MDVILEVSNFLSLAKSSAVENIANVVPGFTIFHLDIAIAVISCVLFYILFAWLVHYNSQKECHKKLDKRVQQRLESALEVKAYQDEEKEREIRRKSYDEGYTQGYAISQEQLKNFKSDNDNVVRVFKVMEVLAEQEENNKYSFDELRFKAQNIVDSLEDL